MAKNSTIVLSAEPKGKFVEGTVFGTPKPGTLMQLKAGILPSGGRFTYEPFAPGTDGKKGEILVLREDDEQGKTMTDAYVTGTRCFMYAPLPGDELNLLLGEVAGTGNTYAIGDRLIANATAGYLIPETGSPQDTVAICNEVVTQVTASHLTWCTIL